MLSGPMFEPAEHGPWKSSHDKFGGHYNIFSFKGTVKDLREFFPTGEADEMNFCLFSTSGIHGSYTTIEEIESRVPDSEDDPGNDLTFLIVQPRLVTLRYGVVEVEPEDIPFLKQLRASSWKVMAKIGAGEPEPEVPVVEKSRG